VIDEEEIMVATQGSAKQSLTMPFTAIGAFDSSMRSEQVLRTLQEAGFTRDQISLVTKQDMSASPVDNQSDTVRDAEIGAAGIGVLGGVAGWLLGISALAIPGIGPVVGLGILWTTLAGVGIGAVAGGLSGALIGHGVDEDQAREYERHVRQGRTLVTVHTANQEQQEQARKILDNAGGTDVRTYGSAA
jgi:uncharacterized membrane protein